ncbi:MAG: hypothetical protein EOM24_11485, partial [Chloroflexia bacterium]|nr:hypothetical protein [Chloroflexia bacterium]
MVYPATRRQTIHVQNLPADSLTCAAALIAASFRHEDFTRHTHNLSTPARQQRFAEAGALRLWLNQASGHQLLAANQGERLWDMPGHGRSDRLTKALEFCCQSAYIMQILDALQIE